MEIIGALLVKVFWKILIKSQYRLFVTDYDQNSVFKFQLSNFQTLASYNELVFPSAICSSIDSVCC